MSRSSHLAAYLANEITQLDELRTKPDELRTKCNVLQAGRLWKLPKKSECLTMTLNT